MKWNDCRELLPEINDWVLVYTPNKKPDCQFAKRTKPGEWLPDYQHERVFFDDEVTHWMEVIQPDLTNKEIQ